MKRHPLVLVEWLDAQGGGGWTPYRDMVADATPCRVRSVGHLLPTPLPGHVSLAQSVTGDAIDAVLHVPDAMVVSVTVLVRSKKSLRKG